MRTPCQRSVSVFEKNLETGNLFARVHAKGSAAVTGIFRVERARRSIGEKDRKKNEKTWSSQGGGREYAGVLHSWSGVLGLTEMKREGSTTTRRIAWRSMTQGKAERVGG